MHQVAKYSLDPRQSHREAILYLVVHYLKKMRNLGLKFKADPKEGFEHYCDADFSGNWNWEFAPVDPSTTKLRSGWIIFYAGCPISWASKLQSQIALSTTKNEVHSHVTGTTWRHSGYEPTTGDEGAKLQGYLYQALCLLQGVWRQHRHSRTCKVSKATPKDQAHKCLLSLFLQTCAQGTHQDLPYRHQRPDCWCSHENFGIKWLPMSSPLYVRCVTSLSHKSEGVLCNWEYVGTYLGYSVESVSFSLVSP